MMTWRVLSGAPHLFRSNHSLNLHVSCSSLRRVSEMPHSISAQFQSLSQRIVSDPADRSGRLRLDLVLFLPHAVCIESVECHRFEAIRNLQPSLSSRIWLTRRSVGCEPTSQARPQLPRCRWALLARSHDRMKAAPSATAAGSIPTELLLPSLLLRQGRKVQ
jgi:hypothetical protein